MTTYQFLGRKTKYWFLISGLLLVIGIASLINWRLPLGIDFRGGAVIELRFDKEVPGVETLRDFVQVNNNAPNAITAKSGDQTFTIRLTPISEQQHAQLNKDIETKFGSITETSYQAVGPSVSADLTRKAAWAIAWSSLLIICYLAYAFRGAGRVSPWRYGFIAVIALIHDVVITLGIFSFLAHQLHLEVDASIVTAMLTVMGFSVHDTIVVFDRVRENLLRPKFIHTQDFEQVVDVSLAQTLNRSIATSLTVIITLTMLTLLGGASVRPFVLALLIGITVGTYSSIFTASPLLVAWQKRASS